MLSPRFSEATLVDQDGKLPAKTGMTYVVDASTNRYTRYGAAIADSAKPFRITRTSAESQSSA
jgi:hypothetical protein